MKANTDTTPSFLLKEPIPTLTRIHDYLMDNIPGDCLIAVGDEDLIKIHYHTNTPWKVLEYCSTKGEIFDIVVEDMDRQSRGLKG